MDGKPYWMLSRQKNNSGQNWCFWAVVLDKTLKSPLDSKAIQPVHPKGNKSWIFSGKTGAEAETPILWPPDVKDGSFEKTLMLGKIEGGRRRGPQRMRWLDGITDSMDMKVWVNFWSWWWTGRPVVLQSMGFQRFGHDWATELNWTEIKLLFWGFILFHFQECTLLPYSASLVCNPLMLQDYISSCWCLPTGGRSCSKRVA